MAPKYKREFRSFALLLSRIFQRRKTLEEEITTASAQTSSTALPAVSSSASLTPHYSTEPWRNSAEAPQREMERGVMITDYLPWVVAAASPKTSSATFPHFSKLPVELQIEIWLYYIQTQPFNPHGNHARLYAHAYHFNGRRSITWTRCFDISPALQVCRLSRELACDYYLLLSKSEKFVYLTCVPEHDQISNYFEKHGSPAPQRYTMTGNSDYVEGSMSFLILKYVDWQHWNLGTDHAICTAGYYKFV